MNAKKVLGRTIRITKEMRETYHLAARAAGGWRAACRECGLQPGQMHNQLKRGAVKESTWNDMKGRLYELARAVDAKTKPLKTGYASHASKNRKSPFRASKPRTSEVLEQPELPLRMPASRKVSGVTCHTATTSRHTASRDRLSFGGEDKPQGGKDALRAAIDAPAGGVVLRKNGCDMSHCDNHSPSQVIGDLLGEIVKRKVLGDDAAIFDILKQSGATIQVIEAANPFSRITLTIQLPEA